MYLVTTKRRINTKIKEHERHCRLQQTENSAIAKHVATTGHRLEFNQMQAIAMVSHSRIYREAIEIYKHQNKVNRKEETLRISDAWLLVLKNTRFCGFNNESVMTNQPMGHRLGHNIPDRLIKPGSAIDRSKVFLTKFYWRILTEEKQPPKCLTTINWHNVSTSQGFTSGRQENWQLSVDEVGSWVRVSSRSFYKFSSGKTSEVL